MTRGFRKGILGAALLTTISTAVATPYSGYLHQKVDADSDLYLRLPAWSLEAKKSASTTIDKFNLFSQAVSDLFFEEESELDGDLFIDLIKELEIPEWIGEEVIPALLQESGLGDYQIGELIDLQKQEILGLSAPMAEFLNSMNVRMILGLYAKTRAPLEVLSRDGIYFFSTKLDLSTVEAFNQMLDDYQIDPRYYLDSTGFGSASVEKNRYQFHYYLNEKTGQFVAAYGDESSRAKQSLVGLESKRFTKKEHNASFVNAESTLKNSGDDLFLWVKHSDNGLYHGLIEQFGLQDVSLFSKAKSLSFQREKGFDRSAIRYLIEHDDATADKNITFTESRYAALNDSKRYFIAPFPKEVITEIRDGLLGDLTASLNREEQAETSESLILTLLTLPWDQFAGDHIAFSETERGSEWSLELKRDAKRYLEESLKPFIATTETAEQKETVGISLKGEAVHLERLLQQVWTQKATDEKLPRPLKNLVKKGIAESFKQVDFDQTLFIKSGSDRLSFALNETRLKEEPAQESLKTLKKLTGVDQIESKKALTPIFLLKWPVDPEFMIDQSVKKESDQLGINLNSLATLFGNTLKKSDSHIDIQGYKSDGHYLGEIQYQMSWYDLVQLYLALNQLQ